MPDRMIRSHGGTRILTDSLASVFSLEAIRPSKEIYLISPYVSNSIIIDNQIGQFTDLFPFGKGSSISLIDILDAFVWNGASVRIICDPNHPSSSRFIRELGDKIEVRRLDENHEKGLVTENFYLHGSMNFTYKGIYVNGENIRITNEVSEVNRTLLSARTRWEESEEL